jgi:translation initiation factor 3 subunit B
MWSPLGTYLATFHQKGLALWGGDENKQITRFAHTNVSDAMFSPKERYDFAVVDFSFSPLWFFSRFFLFVSYILTTRPKPDYLPVDDQSMLLWDVVTSAKKKAFMWDSKDRPSAGSLK